MEKTKLEQWLLHSSIHGNHGEVYSWINPVHQGYLYNEIVGYFITYLVALYDQEHDENKKQEYLKEALKSVSCLQKNSWVSTLHDVPNTDYHFCMFYPIKSKGILLIHHIDYIISVEFLIRKLKRNVIKKPL
jgi:hypothetical protein